MLTVERGAPSTSRCRAARCARLFLDRALRRLYDLPVTFDAEIAAAVGVMPREGGDADVQWFDVGPNEGPSTLDRWTVDLADGKVRGSTSVWSASDIGYGYAPTTREGVEGGDTLLKHDFVRASTESRSFGAEKSLGEFVFYPSSPDADEDEGVLMGYVYDRPTDHSKLAILDAKTLEGHRKCQIAASSSRRIPRELGP